MSKYIVILTALMLVLFGLEQAVLSLWLPAYRFDLLPVVPAFFVVFGVLAIRFVYAKKQPGVSALMGLKVLKILLSMIIILVYVLLIKDNAVAFLASYLIFFSAYLCFETWLLTTLNKKIKIEKQ